MKKLLIILFLMFLAPLTALGKEQMSFDLQKGKSYVLLVDSSAENVIVSDKKILTANSVVNLYSDRQQILIHTFNNGVVDVFIKTNAKVYEYKIKVVDETTKSYDDIFELDFPGQGVAK